MNVPQIASIFLAKAGLLSKSRHGWRVLIKSWKRLIIFFNTLYKYEKLILESVLFKPVRLSNQDVQDKKIVVRHFFWLLFFGRSKKSNSTTSKQPLRNTEN